ncbi:MAG TPA: GFA family protein [Rhizomicrobium sp.]|jgi:hypothetical protein
MTNPPITGGCLCGALRYEVSGAPGAMGHCYCEDCRKASGSGFIPFMMVPAPQLRITGAVLTHSKLLQNGRHADRNSCAVCGGLVFGGILGKTEQHTIYAGSLDDPTLFKPAIAINVQGRPDWALVPEGLTQFLRMPE